MLFVLQFLGPFLSLQEINFLLSHALSYRERVSHSNSLFLSLI
jgi:hypothetical protein